MQQQLLLFAFSFFVITCCYIDQLRENNQFMLAMKVCQTKIVFMCHHRLIKEKGRGKTVCEH